ARRRDVPRAAVAVGGAGARAARGLPAWASGGRDERRWDRRRGRGRRRWAPGGRRGTARGGACSRPHRPRARRAACGGRRGGVAALAGDARAVRREPGAPRGEDVRLIFATQVVDPSDPVLGATVPKLRALAARVDELVVLADRAVDGVLPENARVHLFGSPSQAGRVRLFLDGLRRELR